MIITDKISKNSNPAVKRNLGAKQAVGKYLAFLDDDSYPDENWLKNAQKILSTNLNVAAVCGPCLTPSSDDIFQKASGLVWSSWLGSGGAGVYRNSIQSRRLVDDFPSVNLIIKKTDFSAVGGYQVKYWPGEDTLICLDITQKLKRGIIYDPSIMVFHHRRRVFIPHLQQITRYAIHRGQFAKKFPANSRRLGYFLPSLFFLYLISLPLISRLSQLTFYPLWLYFLLLLITFVSFFTLKKQNLATSILATTTIPLTHIYYGALFLLGFFKKDLKFSPHQTDKITGNYVGG